MAFRWIFGSFSGPFTFHINTLSFSITFFLLIAFFVDSLPLSFLQRVVDNNNTILGLSASNQEYFLIHAVSLILHRHFVYAKHSPIDD